MPPKHKLGRKRSETHSDTWSQYVHSSKSDKSIVHSTVSNSIGDGKSSVDPHSISLTTDVLTITANDRLFIRISIQILQYELKRKRINVESMLEQAHMEGDEISLPTSIPCDWRLVLQDSITTDALQQGCLSLFEHVNSGLSLTQIDVFHAVLFLEYATMHIEHREYPHKQLLETIFPEEEKCPTKLTSALITLVCHPSDKLRAAALSFFDVGIANSSMNFSLAMATTGLLPQLFESLKPHSIPINGTTIDFHRHITSIIDKFVVCTSNNKLGLLAFQLRVRTTKDELLTIVDPIFRPFCAYLRHLLAPPVCPTDYHCGLSLLTKTKTFLYNITVSRDDILHVELQRFCDETRKIMVEEFASSLGLGMKREALHELLFGERSKTDELRWAETFENILVRLSEGKHFSDWGLEAFLKFISNRPTKARLVFRPNGTFSIEVDDRIISSFERSTKSLRTLLTHTRPDHAASILAQLLSFTCHLSSAALRKDIKSGCFSGIFSALTPSKLPFTKDFIPLHKQLVDVMDSALSRMKQIAAWRVIDQSRRDLNRSYLSFIEQTRDYIVHLSLHPFTFVPYSYDNFVLDFLTHFFGSDFENSLTKPFREKLRKDMDTSALSSSSAPFILTSELVCRLTDDEIMNVVDRIVALLESDSPISDDTILRICAFLTNQLKSVYLPELFRMAGRSTEQYFHALNSLLSLTIDCFGPPPFDNLHPLPSNSFTFCPIKSLLCPMPTTFEPTFDEWDDVDLATVGVVLPFVDEDRLSFNSVSLQLLQFAAKVLPQLSHCASRLTPSQLERLLSPSIDVLFKFFVPQLPDNPKFRMDRNKTYIELSRLCEQRVIAQCLSRLGFFSRIVDGLLTDRLFFEYQNGLGIFLCQARDSSDEAPEWKTLQRTVHHFLEEGWQDVLDFLLVRKKDSDYAMFRIDNVKEMMQFLGANFHCRLKWVYTR
ncbi:hypothetical protein BLNAU_2998 [Blattamonas nauphoetae]|uniref:Uncharacterized protein n=1 Tax=Blattamonas nauphoetae TaxID=2049346 RepID=A0ABQ9YDX7_9EUKA|nr:hypothetical protein BLNAU_2998 [Blattamonas nauphoetae]